MRGIVATTKNIPPTRSRIPRFRYLKIEKKTIKSIKSCGNVDGVKHTSLLPIMLFGTFEREKYF